MALPSNPARFSAQAPARALMFQGTGSDVGKSLIVAGLARAFTNRGLRVAPFKPQNMGNNAAVTMDGGEIGRAQEMQARACRLPPSVHMNPVLLKPQSQTGAQIIVQGKLAGMANARDYQSKKGELMPFVLESFQHLKERADLVLVEGAGSASEVNLRERDIANMGFAQAANVPVILIGDIDRGGVIASLVGTKHVIDATDAALIRGFLVNRFRGDPSLFDDGMRIIAQQTGWAPLGLIPHFEEARQLPAEDGLGLTRKSGLRESQGKIRIVVPILPSISNFDDLDPLEAESDVEILRIWPGQALPGNGDLVILPGSRSVFADLAALREAGFDVDIAAHLRRGGHLLGIGGGYHMLGNRISGLDPVSGDETSVAGLGLFDLETVLSQARSPAPAAGQSHDGISLRGYELPVGDVINGADVQAFARFDDGRHEGAISANGRIIGTSLHGLFADDAQRHAWLQKLGGEGHLSDHDQLIETILDNLAAHLEKHVDLDVLLSHAR